MIIIRNSFRAPRPNLAVPPLLKPVELRSALIVDDHPLFCDALAMTLTGLVGIESIDSVGTLDAALARLDGDTPPDVVVLDLNLPDVNGLDGVVRLRQAVPGVPIVVVSSLDELKIIRALLKAGINGFVPKHAVRDEFRAAFAAISRGEIYAPQMALEPGSPSLSDEAIARLGLLTRQQAKILQLVCAGLMNKQIAYELSIAETTVKAHVTAIMRKLGVQTRMQAVLFAQEASFTALTPEE
ncbi:response regulator transcription factor [Sinorhizobium alkalisoli]|uniref:DNA-binding response regulator n=1 Tax=Sinorhizobium alkalisoli TaxID=1752398 RepID=A0A1E3V4P4_9HYPH|nr:response regulator transcription factor [Sinorhizobium alkalisoli]ODR88602.1 DNA-binding response regulator [Sinorhizobium alkalisoli]